jgi:hypothetical protein
VNPEFRAVQDEYVRLGADAMQAKLCGLRAGSVIMGFRSLPGLPKYLRVSPTSAAHYEAFTRGELSAYLHLSGEQGVADGTDAIEGLARLPVMDDEHVREFLRGFKLPTPAATDGGAVASVRKLIADVQPSRPLKIRGQLRPLLTRYVDSDLTRMTAAEQRVIYAQLDEQIRRNDPELWRTKQVSDFLGGIWAQGYGQIYLGAIVWAMRLRIVGRVIVIVTLVAIAIRVLVRRRHALPAVAISHRS